MTGKSNPFRVQVIGSIRSYHEILVISPDRLRIHFRGWIHLACSVQRFSIRTYREGLIKAGNRFITHAETCKSTSFVVQYTDALRIEPDDFVKEGDSFIVLAESCTGDTFGVQHVGTVRIDQENPVKTGYCRFMHV